MDKIAKFTTLHGAKRASVAAGWGSDAARRTGAAYGVYHPILQRFATQAELNAAIEHASSWRENAKRRAERSRKQRVPRFLC